MATAFQGDAFQTDAFQIEDEAPAVDAELIAQLEEQIRVLKLRSRAGSYDPNTIKRIRIQRNNQLIMALVGSVVHGGPQ